MSALSLQPFSALIDWQLPRQISVMEWQALFNAYFELLAEKSAAEENTVIGHIKGFVKLPQNGFIQISAVSASRSATGSVKDDPENHYTQLALTLNMLVYGLSFQQAKTIVEQSAAALLQTEGVSIHIQEITDPSHSSHNHDPPLTRYP